MASRGIPDLVLCPALTEPPVTGTLALQGARRRSHNNEEDR
jgi:hypothetical protein